MRRRVVITGSGLVTAAGTDTTSFWSALMQGRSFVRPLLGFSYAELGQLLGAEVALPEQDRIPAHIDPNPYRARCLELALAAARRAFAEAAPPLDDEQRQATGVVIGTTMGEERQIAAATEGTGQADVGADAEFFSRSNNHRLAAMIAAEHGFLGPVYTINTACSSGNAAIAFAYDLVASGEAEIMLAGGADTLTRLIYCGFHRMGALSSGVCRPFDKVRDGVSFGEGAGVIVLEALEHALSRSANILAEIAGYGMSNEAYHITAPEPSGEGFARSMRDALRNSGLTPDQVDYVSAHGTGTPYNDKCESSALFTVFGERAKDVPMSSVKAMIGHTNGAASAIEAIACMLAIRHGAIPPTAGFSNQEPGFDIDCVPGKGRQQRVDVCLNNSAGFGGQNVCLVIRRLQ